MTQISHMQSVSFGDGNANYGNISGTFNTFHLSDEDAPIMRWLSPLEPNNRHQGVRTERFDGVGNWLLEASEFRKWRCSEGGDDKAVLFCSGNPGVGKTYLSSLVVDSLCDRAQEDNIAVAGLYCDFLSQQEQTTTNIMGAILKQLVSRGGIPDHLREAFQKGKKEFGGRAPLLADLMGMLKIVIASLPRVFICIDALDECLPKRLPEILESLRDIVQESPRTRIFLTGRPHAKEDVQRYFSAAVVILISPNPDDIRNYVATRLDRDAEPEAMSNDLRVDIVRVILEKISNVFLLVSLNIDAILAEVTIRQRRKKLEEMTQGNGLSEAYTATLRRMKAQKGYKSVLGLKALMWVLYSERPLRAEELCHALGVEIGSADLDPENIPALRTVLASCLGLITVEGSFLPTVRLVHFTLQEYLSSKPTLFHSPHSEIAEVCLTYLNFGFVGDLSPTLLWAPSTTPLLEYASVHWGRHTRRRATENIKILALRLLDRFDEHISVQLLSHHDWEIFWRLGFSSAKRLTGFTGLHGVAYFGIEEMVPAVLDMREWDVNAADCTGSTALTWAATRGHERVVKMLLEQKDVNPDQPDTKYGRTPLSWVAESGNERIAKMLLERKDVNPNQTTKHGQTPLLLAAANGHEGRAKMLLKRKDVNPNQPDTKYGRTPLSWAAKDGHEGIVKMLLERKDINPDQPDAKYGPTPLLWAAGNGHEGIVKMLLERNDVNPNQTTKHGQTPLLWAAENGHEGRTKILLKRKDVNTNHPDTKYGRTPLSWAAKDGHEGIVKMLLERKDVNPDQPDTKYGPTPLSWATGNGHEEIVKMLLERGDVNPDHPDTKYGRTPLSWAAENGHERIVKMLLERGDVNPGHPDTKYGRTPLSWAAENGHEGIVKILLKREDINTNHPDTKYGRTPLWWAAERGHEGVVKMLLERKDLNPDQPDTQDGRTPLSWAAGNGHEGIVKMLLERRDVNPDHPDTKYGRTPLSRAAGNGREGIVKMLLERKDVNPNQTITKHGQTPLSWATGNGHEGIVTMLLKLKDVNPNHPDTKYGRTPLSWAAKNGHEGIVKMLLERKDVNPDQLDTIDGRTPLWWAAWRGHDGIVKMLLERKDVNPDQPDTKYGKTPLWWAAWKGHERIVRMLMERKGDRTAMPDNVNQAPQPVAPPEGHDAVARILLERGDVNSAAADRSNPMSLPPTAMHPDEPVVETRSGSPDPNIDITDSSSQPVLQSAADGDQPRVLDRGDPVSQSVDTGLSTQPPRWSRTFSTGPLKRFYRRIKTKTHPRKA